MKLIDLTNNTDSDEIKLSESDLSNVIYNNWHKIFNDLVLIGKEFSFKGDIRKINGGGRLDFFAFNKISNCFVIIEIKNEYDKNIRSQILDYADFIEENLEYAYLKSKEILKDIPTLNKANKIELVLIAKEFKPNDYRIIKKIEYKTELITYRYFSNNFLLLNRISNIADVDMSTDSSMINIASKPQDIVDDFWNYFKQASSNGTLKNCVDYKVDENYLLLRVSKIHKSFSVKDYRKASQYIQLSSLRKLLLKSDEYVSTINSTRFSNQVSSAYIFDLTKLKTKYDI